MKYRTKTDWLALIEKQLQSGLSVSEFCRQEGLGRTYFQKKLNDFRAGKETSSPVFIKAQPIKPRNSDRMIQIQYHHSQIALPTSLPPSWLADFVRALA
ncbi:MAG: hypothetical protein Q9M92_02000 [Enterobacterales bacterium]|nr:hypothetical protein [Enterobacterales bacterium]MDQ7048359.1 hypothetical protein [Enterobacterales bacterium]